MKRIKHFSTWADRILNTYAIGPSEADLLTDFNIAMSKNGIGTRIRHMIIEDFLNQEVLKGRRYDFRKALENFQHTTSLSLTPDEVKTSLRILSTEVQDD